MTEFQPLPERTTWIEACRSKMMELDPRIGVEEVNELAEALWNRASLRTLGAIATALKISHRRQASVERWER